MHDLGRTVVAVATPPGRGGIGAIRLSGPEAFEIAAALFVPRDPRRALVPGAPRFGRFVGKDDHAIDHGYLVLFAAPASFTGEPTAELWTHGSPAVQRGLIDAALTAGAVLAGAGEFTYRALRHGRLDLARAEAVRDLVAARTMWQARQALAQAEGALSRRLAPLREALADLTARVEAAVEFAEEPETFLSAGHLADGLAALARQAASFLEGFRSTRVLREGAVVAITGCPNVGKSSLFNGLLERDRAIVAATPGTTRDTLEEEIDLDGVPVRLVDTAGLRDSGDVVEAEGVRRAREAAAAADVILLVVDGSAPTRPTERDVLRRQAPGGPPVLVALNKADLGRCHDPAVPSGAIRTSAQTGEGVDALRRALRASILGGERIEEAVVCDARHAAALQAAVEALDRARAALEAGLSEEAVAEDLREATARIGEITGERGADALYDRIFATFCIGK